jgi:hypothetical protein
MRMTHVVSFTPAHVPSVSACDFRGRHVAEILTFIHACLCIAEAAAMMPNAHQTKSSVTPMTYSSVLPIDLVGASTTHRAILADLESSEVPPPVVAVEARDVTGSTRRRQ